MEAEVVVCGTVAGLSLSIDDDGGVDPPSVSLSTAGVDIFSCLQEKY
jgi:hypothetical protein